VSGPARLLRRWGLLVVAAALAGGCAGSRDDAGAVRLTVFAAASLTEAFDALASDFEATHPDTLVELHLAGTPTLVLQLREGATAGSPPADVVATADEASMQELVDAGLVASPAVFARNRLAIATPVGNPAGVRVLADLARAGLRVALADPAVPAGRYTAEALRRAGVDVPRATHEPSVKAVATRVELGEVDAGVVYLTDVQAAPGRLEAVAIPPADNVVARYPIAVVAGTDRGGQAEAFVAHVRSPRGQAVLTAAGFLASAVEGAGR
jgi:molybdate transport system substrate-binding protein